MQDRKLTEIPDWVSNLEDLEILVLDFNSIASLPEWLFDLNRLSTLRLYENNITEISNAIGQLQNLNLLDISYNQLESLPESIGGLTQIRFLYIGGNNFSGIPDWVSNLDLIALDASASNLTEIPVGLANMNRLVNLYLENNQIKTIPEFVTDFPLRNFRIDGNELTDLPSSIDNLSTLNWLGISNNFLSFSHVQQVRNTLPGVSIFWFSPQKPIYKDTILYFKKGVEARIPLGIDEDISDNEYRWTKDRANYIPDPINNINSNELIISTVSLGDVGNYLATVINPRFPDLTLESYPVGIRVCDRQSDSMQLVRLYNGTNGRSWGNSNGWLTTAPIEQWYGITTDPMGCVNKIDLSGNNLTGTLPGLDLNTLDTLIIRENALSGDIPNDLNTPYIKYADLASNSFDGALPPILTEWMQLTNLDVSDNFLRESIPPEIGDLCELEQLEMDGNDFEGNIPTELTQLFNLKKGQVNL